MRTKSFSNKFNFNLYCSLYLSGSRESCDQTVVSKTRIFRFPQIFWEAKWRNQCLFNSDRATIIGIGTYWRGNVICESDSHFRSSFKRCKSFNEKLWKSWSRNEMHFRIRFGLKLFNMSKVEKQ